MAERYKGGSSKEDTTANQLESSQPTTVEKAPTGKERWGEGGKFRINKDGKRVKVAVKD